MREAIMEDQDEFLMRNTGHTEVGLEANNAALLEDVAQNADLYIANQDVNTQTQVYSLLWFTSTLQVNILVNL